MKNLFRGIVICKLLSHRVNIDASHLVTINPRKPIRNRNSIHIPIICLFIFQFICPSFFLPFSPSLRNVWGWFLDCVVQIVYVSVFVGYYNVCMISRLFFLPSSKAKIVESCLVEWVLICMLSYGTCYILWSRISSNL